MRESLGSSAFTDVVLDTFFGFRPVPRAASCLADPRTPRPFQGTLANVRYRGQLLNLIAGNSGVMVLENAVPDARVQPDPMKGK
jgi:hypothetical protein